MGIAEVQHAVIDRIGQQEALDAPGEGLQGALNNAFRSGEAGRQVEDFLHGTWLGHPLHSAITDVPVGAWTVAQVLDILEGWGGRDEFAPGADMAITIGLVGALGAAVTGLTDWKDTDGDDRRIGMVHGMLNGTATALYALSLLARRRGDRTQGRALSTLGFGTVMLGALIGGDLVYRQNVGVTHAPQPDAAQPGVYTPAIASAELAEGQPMRREVNGMALVLVRDGGQVYALADTCSHMGGPLSDGKLIDGCIECPWHGSQFALADGAVCHGPATTGQPCYNTRERNGMVEVEVPR